MKNAGEIVITLWLFRLHPETPFELRTAQYHCSKSRARGETSCDSLSTRNPFVDVLIVRLRTILFFLRASTNNCDEWDVLKREVKRIEKFMRAFKLNPFRDGWTFCALCSALSLSLVAEQQPRDAESTQQKKSLILRVSRRRWRVKLNSLAINLTTELSKFFVYLLTIKGCPECPATTPRLWRSVFLFA